MRDDYRAVFRMDERDAAEWLPPGAGRAVPDTAFPLRDVVARPGDELWDRLREAHWALRARGQPDGLFRWHAVRTHSAQSLEAAELFRISGGRPFEPSGEACGTVYDESNACPVCRVGTRIDGDLVLDLRRVPGDLDIEGLPLPRRRDVAVSITDEWIVSQRFVDVVRENHMIGFEFRPVRREPPARRRPVRTWYQLMISSAPVHLAIPPTRVGINPFDEDAEGVFRCPLGHVAGRRLLTEVFIRRADWDGADALRSVEHLGIPEGPARPEPVLLISQRLRRLLLAEGIQGLQMEIAHAV